MRQFILTPAAGKRLIAKAAMEHGAVRSALQSGTIVIIAGTTNGYVAEEILKRSGQSDGFDKRRFFRGVTLPPSRPTTETGRLPDEGEFAGDVVIVRGQWQKGKTIFDVADYLKEGDVVLKGANAVNLSSLQAGVLIGHPKGGTIAVALQAVIGRRVRLILPVGIEKRVSEDIHVLAAKMNAPGARGPRLLPVSGEILTELEAVSLLTGAKAELVAGGGVGGAEGSIRLCIAGDPKQEDEAETLLKSVSLEPLFIL